MARTQIKAGPLTYRDRVLALWRANPAISVKRMHAITGAPQSTCRKLFAELRANGTLPRRRGEPRAA